jgi:23S rRNA (guanosine2251-2'-O)-methyltransferase
MREILYGRQPVRETLRAGRRQTFRVMVAAGVRPTGIVGQILGLAEQSGISVQTVNRQELDKLGGEVNHQGLAAEVSGYPYVDLTESLEAARQSSAPPFFLLLDHIQDPQNLGSLMRTAEAVGVHGVVIPTRRASGVTAAAVRASAGAAEHVRVVQIANLVRAVEQLKAEGIWIAGLDAAASSQLYTEADLSGPLGLVVGSEGQGLGRLVRERCDFVIRLPMLGQIESLNAGVAAAIALYEARRQRG